MTDPFTTGVDAMSVDLSAYFARIGYTGLVEPTLDVLRELHARHPAAIAFESLDPFLGQPVAIDPRVIEAKLVGARRGGYCFEQNALFHDVLAAIGYRVTALGARVVWMAPGRDAPMTHRMTLVDTDNGRFLADVGFGGQTPTAPLLLDPGSEQPTTHGVYRVTRDGNTYVTEMRLGQPGEPRRWEPMYRFTLDPQSRADFEVANWFASTHPRGRFTRNLVAARVAGAARVNLLNATVTIRGPGDATEERRLGGPAELRQVLEETIGLVLPVPAETLWNRLPREPVPLWP